MSTRTTTATETVTAEGRPGDRRAPLGSIALLAVGTLIAILAGEAALRVLRPQGTFRAADELADFRTGGERIRASYELDPELGFRPIFDGRQYTKYGTMVNSYSIEKPPGVSRLLFIGDSVTRRSRLVDALRALYGDDCCEYWNAGVESFNTVQEVRYYQRYNAKIQPDHVILTFHPNDFQTTPVAFLDAADQLVVLAPRMPARRVNRWLFEHSLSYRALLGLLADEPHDEREIAAEVNASLTALKRDVEAAGARLTVVVLPLLQPPKQWTDRDRSRHATILATLAALGIRHFDLRPALEATIAEGVDATERPDDPWHPSAAAAERFAAFLRTQEVL